ncbi:hypothetical protein C8A03DRAFT_18838, partial [Achaetomium macrosporum]
LELALELQHEDLERLKKAAKGKGREGETGDLNFAIQLYEAELALCTLIASDQSMYESIARAVRLDADLIGTILLEEEQAALDREFARILDEQLLAKLEALYVSPEEHPAESSTRAASRPVPRTRGGEQPKIECTGCGDKRYHLDVSRCVL